MFPTASHRYCTGERMPGDYIDFEWIYVATGGQLRFFFFFLVT